MKIKSGNLAVAVFLLSLSIALVTSIPSYASEKTLKETVITGIEVLDNGIQITADAPIAYKLSRPEDPFRVTIDIEGGRLGKFVDKMFPDRSGVTEIEPVQILKPAAVARLNILLQSPAVITPEVKGNVLVITIKGDGKIADGPAGEGDRKKTQTPLEAEHDKMPAPDLTAGNPDDETETGPDSAEEITELRFNKTAEGAEIILTGDGDMPDPEVFKLDGRVIIDIPDVLTTAPLPADIALPVKGIQYRTEEGKLRFIVDMEAGSKASVAAVDDKMIVHISSAGITDPKTPTETSMKSACGREGKKQPVSFDVQEADLSAVLGILNYDMTGCNIVVNPEDVKGKKITMKLSNVPWDQALDIILRTFGLERIIEGNVIRVVTKGAYDIEQKMVEDQKKKADEVNITSRVFSVNYAKVDKIKDAIVNAGLTKKEYISTDERTRSVIVRDIPDTLDKIDKLIKTLDKPTRQVLIEARMVEVSKNFSYQLGIEWGAYLSPNASKSALYGVGSASTTGISGATPVSNLPGATGGGGTTPSVTPLGTYYPTLVSLGTSGSPTGAFTVGYLNAARTLGLDMRISALESSGNGKTVSSPKIMTLDNEKATIKQGRKIPYSTVSNSGTQVQFIDAALGLVVTPQIGPDKTILLNIVATNDQADFSNTSQGLPSITTNEADAEVLIKDGETVVIGGILTSTEQVSNGSVPGISKIPILGELFKNTSKTETTDELLIFITPRVIEQ